MKRPDARHRGAGGPTAPLRAVLFGLGDTVIQYGPVDRRRVFRQGAHRTYELWAQRQKRMPDFQRYYLHQWFALHWGHLKQVLLRREMDSMHYIRRACRKLWLSAPDTFFTQLAWAWYEPLAERATIEPGTHELLDTLRCRGYRLALISNTFVPGFVLDQHLSQLGLLDFFPLRIYSCDVGHRKPSRRIFHLALDRLGIEPTQAAFVGDRLDADVRGAHRAGMHAIWKRQNQTATKAPDGVQVVETLPQLLGTALFS